MIAASSTQCNGHIFVIFPQYHLITASTVDPSMSPPLMSVPIADVVVTVFTAVSALVRLCLDVHIHHVAFQGVLVHEPLATLLADKPLL